MARTEFNAQTSFDGHNSLAIAIRRFNDIAVAFRGYSDGSFTVSATGGTLGQCRGFLTVTLICRSSTGAIGERTVWCAMK